MKKIKRFYHPLMLALAAFVLFAVSCSQDIPYEPVDFTGWYKGTAITTLSSNNDVFLTGAITTPKMFIYHTGGSFAIVKMTIPEDSETYWKVGYGTFSETTGLFSATIHGVTGLDGSYPITDLTITGEYNNTTKTFNDCTWTESKEISTFTEQFTAYASGTMTITTGSNFN